jgi:hypothetical protein
VAPRTAESRFLSQRVPALRPYGVSRLLGVSDLGATLVFVSPAERAIVALLVNYRVLTDPIRSGSGTGGGGLVLMPHADHCEIRRSRPPRCTCELAAVAELERLLKRMRDDRGEPYRGFPLSTLRWHLVAWYVSVEQVASWHPVVLRRGHRIRVAVGQDVLRDESGRPVPSVRVEHRPRRDGRAVKATADVGVEWLARNWRGRQPALVAEPLVGAVA